MNSPAPVLQIENRYSARKATLLRLLAEVDGSGLCRHTVYLTPNSADGPGALDDSGLDADIASVTQELGSSDTGHALFVYDDQITAVTPPFPVGKSLLSEGADTAPLRDLLGTDFVIGVVLLRLGRYAVGVLRGDKLVASKSGSRYVKSRHRAGGSSQRRFERSRERLIRELFDKTCQTARAVFAPFQGRIDFLLMGGERHTLAAFVRNCVLVRQASPVMLRRTLEVDRPGHQALERVHDEVWKSRVVVFRRTEGIS